MAVTRSDPPPKVALLFTTRRPEQLTALVGVNRKPTVSVSPGATVIELVGIKGTSIAMHDCNAPGVGTSRASDMPATSRFAVPGLLTVSTPSRLVPIATLPKFRSPPSRIPTVGVGVGVGIGIGVGVGAGVVGVSEQPTTVKSNKENKIRFIIRKALL
jgi:hypothetical protein